MKGHPWLLLFSSLSKFKWPNHTVAVRIQIISPPLEHQAALFKMLGFVGISSKCGSSEVLPRLLTTNLTQLKHYRPVCENRVHRCPASCHPPYCEGLCLWCFRSLA